MQPRSAEVSRGQPRSAEISRGQRKAVPLPSIKAPDRFVVDWPGRRTVGLLSSSFSRAIDADQLRLPLCTWEAGRDALLTGASEEAQPLRTR